MGHSGALDGVVVATTPDHQAEVVRAVAIAPVPLLVEKPLGLSAAVVTRLLDDLRRSGRPAPVVVNFVHLWAPAFRALKGIIAGAREGVQSIVSEGWSNGPFRAWSPLHDYGPHDVAMCLDLLGIPGSVAVRSARRLPPHDPAGALFEAQLVMGETPVRITVGNGGATKRRSCAVTLRSDRTLVYDDSQPHPLKLLDDGQPVPVDQTMPLDAVLTDFLGRIDLWREDRLTPDAATASVALAAKVAAILDGIAAAAEQR
jgi:predicted dehydrogenase